MVQSLEEKYYVYAHVRKDTNKVFYVGKGYGKRAFSKASRNRYWRRIVEKHGYYVFFYLENVTEIHAYSEEKAIITDIEPEANFAEGGIGGNTWKNYPKELADIRKLKMSKKMKELHSGKNNPMYGKNISEKHRNILKSVNKSNPTKTSPVLDTLTGKKYVQQKHAMEHLGIPKTSFYRLLGKRFISLD